MPDWATNLIGGACVALARLKDVNWVETVLENPFDAAMFDAVFEFAVGGWAARESSDVDLRRDPRGEGSKTETVDFSWAGSVGGCTSSSSAAGAWTAMSMGGWMTDVSIARE